MRRAHGLAVLLALALAVAAAADEEDSLAPLLKQLAAKETKARTAAARALGRVAGADQRRRAAAALHGVLGDATEEVRVTAAVGLARLDAADDKVIDVLIAALRSPDWYTRWQACLALGTLGPAARAAAPALTNAAFDPELDLAWEASIALARVAADSYQVQEALARLVASDGTLDRAMLLHALEKAARLDLLRDWLLAELMTDEHHLAQRSYELLVKHGKLGIDLLPKAIESEDPRVRVLALQGLTELKATGAAEAIRKAVADPVADVRLAAIATIVALKIKAAAADVARALDDDSHAVQVTAVTALEKLGVVLPEAGPALVRLLKEQDGDLAHSALCVVAPDVGDWIRVEMRVMSTAGERRRLAGFAYLRLPHEPRKEGCLQLLLASLEDNRQGPDLVAALRDVLDPDRDTLLIKLLGAGDAEIRRDAAMLLAHLAADREAAARAIARLRADPNPDLVKAAERALEVLGVR